MRYGFGSRGYWPGLGSLDGLEERGSSALGGESQSGRIPFRWIKHTHAEQTHCDEATWPAGRNNRLVIMAGGECKRCRMSNAAREVHLRAETFDAADRDLWTGGNGSL